ncbi:hypothetical protein VQ045_19935 [Aurantimonas sp. E1-2-R+4]|uniref:hypothetical protein n=1 Tax=Aurantimonas sp. E1-2-R+4 TaxID=3113714 RepID=UPI002F9307D2
MKHLFLALPFAALVLTGCQTVEEAATKKVEAVCAQGGYGPGSRYHDYCLTNLKPVAVQMEQERRQRVLAEGLGDIARGLNPPPPAKMTCVQTGAVTRCY